MRYICSICGYVYDEAGKTPFAELPEDWRCPLCRASKSEFHPERVSPETVKQEAAPPVKTDIRPLTAAETSALCTNLAKGCEKQYQPEQAAAFRKLAAWFASQVKAASDPSFDRLLVRVNADLERAYRAWVAEHPYDLGKGWGREPWSQAEMPLDDALVAAAAAQSDAALVIIGRTAGEDQDAADQEGSYRLTALERDMLARVRRAFSTSASLRKTSASTIRPSRSRTFAVVPRAETPSMRRSRTGAPPSSLRVPSRTVKTEPFASVSTSISPESV